MWILQTKHAQVLQLTPTPQKEPQAIQTHWERVRRLRGGIGNWLTSCRAWMRLSPIMNWARPSTATVRPNIRASRPDSTNTDGFGHW